MCSGAKKREKVRAENEQKRLNKEAERKQKELDQLAEQRTALAEQQQARSTALQAQMIEQQLGQEKRVEGLQAQQAAEVLGIRAAGNTAANSLRVLAQKQPTAPSAVVTRKRSKASSPGATQSTLRIGSTSRSAGSGSNLSI